MKLAAFCQPSDSILIVAKGLKVLTVAALATVGIQLPVEAQTVQQANAHKCMAKVRATEPARHKISVVVWCKHPEPGGVSVLVAARALAGSHAAHPNAIIGFWRHPVPIGSTKIREGRCRDAQDPIYAVSCRAKTEEAAGFKFAVRLRKTAYCRLEIEVAQPTPAIGPEGLPHPPTLGFWDLYRNLPRGCKDA